MNNMIKVLVHFFDTLPCTFYFMRRLFGYPLPIYLYIFSQLCRIKLNEYLYTGVNRI